MGDSKTQLSSKKIGLPANLLLLDSILLTTIRSTMECNCSLGPLEREILEVVWTQDCASVRCVLVALNQRRTKIDKLAYTTVMTILKRLMEKGILTRYKEGRGYRYQARQTKQEFIQQTVRQEVDRLKQDFGLVVIEALKQEI